MSTKVEQLFLSSEFGPTPPSVPVPVPGTAATSAATIPNFLHFTPDESVTQSMLSQSQCNKQEATSESEMLGLVDPLATDPPT